MVEVEGLVSGTKLTSVGSGAGSEDMLISNSDVALMSTAELSIFWGLSKIKLVLDRLSGTTQGVTDGFAPAADSLCLLVGKTDGTAVAFR